MFPKASQFALYEIFRFWGIKAIRFYSIFTKKKISINFITFLIVRLEFYLQCKLTKNCKHYNW